jgi:signal transduction histidine kinase
MRTPWKTWCLFTGALLVVLTAMGWISVVTLRLERTKNEAQVQAALEENVRLALWRMESSLAPLLPQESARHYFVYSAFYPSGRAYSCMFDEPLEGESLVPSPILTRVPEQVLLHFQVAPDGEFTSPQIAGEQHTKAFLGCGLTLDGQGVAAQRLTALKSIVTRDSLLGLLPTDPTAAPKAAARFSTIATRVEPVPSGLGRQTILKKNNVQLRQFCAPLQVQGEGGFNVVNWFNSPADVREGLFHPLWIGDTLLLARQVAINGQIYLQGCWLDWTGIQTKLRGLIGDLLPDADVVPATGGDPEPQEHVLATLPIRLLPGRIERSALVSEASSSPVQLSLAVAWGCVLLAAGAVGILLGGAVSLSSRRGAFVSAVTHELRTPLTTFRMYTEMLAEDMVTDEDERRSYLEKLRSEADRLAHLVENVLGFSRLEAVKARQLEEVTLEELLTPSLARLTERAEQAGMELEADLGAAAQTRACVEVAAVEQILFNLVDNAAKYASDATDRRLHVEAFDGPNGRRIRVRDHGPGISEAVRRKLFSPFSKSDRDAANSAPGIGLGLAFSRQLARSMGGTLKLCDGTSDQAKPGTSSHPSAGACFELTLPAGEDP